MPVLTPLLALAIAAALLTIPAAAPPAFAHHGKAAEHDQMAMAKKKAKKAKKPKAKKKNICGRRRIVDGVRLAPIAQIVTMMMMMATNCSSTRSRISFCDVLGEPPRIMLMRPSTSTIATAPIAIGNDVLRHELSHADADSTARR